MWGVVGDSSEKPLAELWGLFKQDDDVSWQHKARFVNNASNGPSTMTNGSASGAA